MKIFIIIFILIALGTCLFVIRLPKKWHPGDIVKRSGRDRRRSFIASKNRMRRSGIERRKAQPR
jgi:hypothetical protein